MKILAKMEDMHVETISGDSKFVLNNGHEEEEDARGIPVPSMHLPLEQHRMPYSSSNGSERLVYGQQLFRDRLGVLHQNNYRAGSSVPLEQQYSSSSAPYDDNDEESVKTEITEETDIEEGEEDQIIPGLVISTTANSAPETKESSENAEPRTSSSGTYVSPTSALAKTDEQTQKPSSPVGNKTEAVPQETEQEQPGSTLESIRSPDNWSETARVQEEVSETANVATSQPAGDDESRREDISSIKSPLRVQSMRAQRLYLNPRQPTEVSPTNSTATYHPASSSASDSLPSPPKPTTVVEKPKIAKKERQSAEQLPKRVSRHRTKLQRYNPDVEAAKPQLLQHETKKEQVQHLRQIKSGKERKKSHESYTPYDPKYDLKVRTRVKARWSSGNRTYKAMITGINADGTYKLLYNDGGRWDRVPRRRILEYAGSASQELKRPRVQTAKKARNKPLKRRRARSKRAESDEEDLPPPKKKRGRRSTGHAKRMEHEFRGLTWSQQKRKWIARIYHKNSTVHLGTFTDPEEAARMYDWAARPLGKKLNFPTDADLRSQEKKLKKVSQKPALASLLRASKKERKNKSPKRSYKKKGKAGRKRKRPKPVEEVVEEVKQDAEEEENEDKGEVESVAEFVDKKQEQYNLVGVFTARKRKKRRLYDPTVEAEKPQWLSKEERLGKSHGRAATSSKLAKKKTKLKKLVKS